MLQNLSPSTNLLEKQNNTRENQPLDLNIHSTKNKKKTLIVVALTIFTIIPLLVFITFKDTSQPLSPIPDNPILGTNDQVEKNSSKEKIGFLPYWTLKDEQNFRYQQLTQLAFFALAIDENGNIIKYTEDGYQEPGWTAFNSRKFALALRKAKESGTKVILTIQAFDSDTITSIVSNHNKKTTVIQETINLLESKNLDGVNIDFEYAGAPNKQTTKNFTLFVQDFNQALKDKNPEYILNVDVFADSSTKVRIWDIPNLANHVDQIIIMAYDFHRASSPIAAPVAPIRGSPKLWEYDILKTIRDFTNTIPPEKIILGVPYYGYEWRTSTENKYSSTYPGTGALATFKRVQKLIEEEKPDLSWDEQALSPRLVYKQGGQIFQIYYDNETSLGIKFDLVNESGLAGIAIWALGYDGTYPNLWNLLAEKFP